MSKPYSLDMKRVSEDFSISEKDFADMNAVLSKIQENGQLHMMHKLLTVMFESQRDFVMKRLAQIHNKLPSQDKEHFNFEKQMALNGEIFTRNFELISRILVREVSEKVFTESIEKRRETRFTEETEHFAKTIEGLFSKPKVQEPIKNLATFTVDLDKKTIGISKQQASPQSSKNFRLDEKARSSFVSTSLNRSSNFNKTGMSHYTAETKVPGRAGYQYVDSEFSHITGSPIKFSKKERFASARSCSPGPMRYDRLGADDKFKKVNPNATFGKSVKKCYFDENKENCVAPGPKYTPSRHYTTSITRASVNKIY